METFKNFYYKILDCNYIDDLDANQLVDQLRAAVKDGFNLKAQTQYGNTLLHAAAERGVMEVVQYLLAEGLDVNQRNEICYTPLQSLVKQNNATSILERLIDNKEVDINYSDDPYQRKCNSLIHNAAEANAVDVVNLLIVKGADFKAKNSFGYTPLDLAAEHNSLAVVELLLSKGSSIGPRTLSLALSNRFINKDLVKLLIEEGADDVQSSLFEELFSGKKVSCLNIALKNFVDVEVIELLLDKGAQIDTNSLPALLQGKGSYYNLKKLREASESYIRWDAKTAYTDTKAGISKLTKLLETLLENGARQYINDKQILNIALQKQLDPDIFELLLKHGADPYKADDMGNTLFKLLERSYVDEALRDEIKEIITKYSYYDSCASSNKYINNVDCLSSLDVGDTAPDVTDGN